MRVSEKRSGDGAVLQSYSPCPLIVPNDRLLWVSQGFV